MIKPIALFYAGTNGSGKSTIREQINDQNLFVIDPDLIAKNNNDLTGNNSQLIAGKDAIKQYLLMLKLKKSFSMETTLSGRSSLKRLMAAKHAGFEVHLSFVGLEHPDLNISRVKHRVLHGGHHIDENVIRTRYPQSMKNLIEAIQFAEIVKITDNSIKPLLCISIKNQQIIQHVEVLPRWIERCVKEIKNRNNVQFYDFISSHKLT